jgi:glycosyl hydrolase family 2
MAELSRRKFLRSLGQGGATFSLGCPLTVARAAEPWPAACASTIEESLNGTWLFRLDPEGRGEAEGWYRPQLDQAGWERVTVPHTWQVDAGSAEYYGAAWYRRDIQAPASWAGQAVRVEFEAVFHSATVWLNGVQVGEHLRKGYTAFTLDLTPALRLGELNRLAVHADNSFDLHMLPRGHSYDWTPDGGIFRPVQILISPPVFIERLDVDARPAIEARRAGLNVAIVARNTSRRSVRLSAAYRVKEEESGRFVLEKRDVATAALEPGATVTLSLPPAELPDPHLWHFDHPHLYRLMAEIYADGRPVHSLPTTFGVRRFEVRSGGLSLNGERVWLMGVERMAGSNPEFGMAEPTSWIDHDHDDLKNLNAVFTRVHWPQDKRVLDYCDRHGILIQEEVPAWGGQTFEGMVNEPSPEILSNGLEQLHEMIQRDRNHPSVVVWGLCNEINGQNPPAYEFARRMLEEAKKLDPHRLCTYASNSLQETPEKDVTGLMDFVECNEYYGTWSKGGVEDVKRNLEAIHRAFPDKPIVISEFGYCECTPERTGGDPERAAILSSHTDAYRRYDYVAGAIFFDYNDYRTHVGDKGWGALKQRVHGVVDLYGSRKPSYDVLRQESSPVEALEVRRDGDTYRVVVATRDKMPAYTLEGYTLRWVVYGFDDLPMEEHEMPLPPLAPGRKAVFQLSVKEENPKRVLVSVVRPTGFPAIAAECKPA